MLVLKNWLMKQVTYLNNIITQKAEEQSRHNTYSIYDERSLLIQADFFQHILIIHITKIHFTILLNVVI